MRHKIDLNITVGERHIDSLTFHSECVELIERDASCSGLIVEVPEGCDGKFQFEIITIHGAKITDTRYVCGDCPQCMDCVNNLCVERCTNGQLCENNTCVECISGTTCSGGRICVQGECRCPIGATWDGTNCIYLNNCPPCSTHNPLTNECTYDCLAVDVCNPQTSTCQECLTSAHCPNNQICSNGECICPQGYIISQFTGNCIPAPNE
jgi:hypothetical protein